MTPIERNPYSLRRFSYPAITVFSVTLATLLMQMVQTRIYSVVFWNHLVYFIVSIALLGFGISGTFLSFGKETWLARKLTLPVATALFIISALAASLLLPQMNLGVGALTSNFIRYLPMFSTYFFAVLPYFFAGWILGSIYRDHADGMHILYFADLTGASLGCLLFLCLIRPLGAVLCVLFACMVVVFPVLVGHRRQRGAVFVGLLSVAIILGVFLFRQHFEQAIVPEPTKAFNNNFSSDGKIKNRIHLFSEWNAISRIDVAAFDEEPPARTRIYIDGDAWTGIPRRMSFPAPPFVPGQDILVETCAPYLLKDDITDVLVIGSGGGIDVWNALRAGATHVDAVEINPTTAAIIKTIFKERSASLFFQPEVHLHVEDGRSFVRRAEQKYDVVMINGIDTFAALSTGAYVLSENYLYTVEAMREYISRLKPGGQLCIKRWEYSVEGLRLFNVALEALYELNISEPDACISSHLTDHNTLLVSNQPFTEQQFKKLDQELALFEQRYSPICTNILYPPFNKSKIKYPPNPYVQSVQARASGVQKEFYAAMAQNVTPVYDDSPFFFHYDRFGGLFSLSQKNSIADLIRGQWASFVLFALLFFTIASVLLFMLLPLRIHGRLSFPGYQTWRIYFMCLGLAFIFIEITLMQRFALLLGHPSRSLAIVLSGLLFAAGIGSVLRQILRISPVFAIVAAIAGALIVAFVYPSLSALMLSKPLWIRALYTLALVMPIGLFMGMPFPFGIYEVSKQRADAVPWMYGINGGATVVGAVLAIIIAMSFSFTAVMLIAAMLYGVAFVCILRAKHAVASG